MIPLSKLAKLATGNLAVDDALELLASMGVDGAIVDVPEESKGDAFQRVARFSLEAGSEVKHLRFQGQDGSRIEALVIVRAGDQSNTHETQRTLDNPETRNLQLAHSI
jgi:hypothetical protein